jgi:hypothetical protein
MFPGIAEARRGSPSVQNPANHRSDEYDRNQWKLIKRTTVSFVADSVPSQVLLLTSQHPTGSSGLSEPMNDVRLLIFHAGRVFYDRTMQFFRDEYLEIRDVTDQGSPEVLFHSGSRGASDSSTQEHILRYDKRNDSVTDIAPREFVNSGEHGLRWLSLEGRAFMVIAERNWPRKASPEDRCHYCPGQFQYKIFRWNQDRSTFEVYRRMKGEKSYNEATEALDGDWPLIQRFERR